MLVAIGGGNACNMEDATFMSENVEEITLQCVIMYSTTSEL